MQFIKCYAFRVPTYNVYTYVCKIYMWNNCISFDSPYTNHRTVNTFDVQPASALFVFKSFKTEDDNKRYFSMKESQLFGCLSRLYTVHTVYTRSRTLTSQSWQLYWPAVSLILTIVMCGSFCCLCVWISKKKKELKKRRKTSKNYFVVILDQIIIGIISIHFVK